MADSSLASSVAYPCVRRRRLPIGAELGRRPRAHFRVWAPRVGPRRGRARPGRSTALEPEGDGYFSGDVRRRAPATGTASGSTTTRSCIPIRRRAFSPTARTARRRSSIRRAFRWTDTAWRGVPLRGPGHLRDARRHLHAARGRGPPPRASCRELARPRHHGDRGDAGRRVPRTLRLGLRRRRPVRADAPLRHARRLPRASSIARTRSASASSSTSSTTTSARTATTCARSRRPTSPTATRTSGARRSTSTARTPGRCASSSSPTPATGSTSSTSTACGSTRRSRSSTHRPSTSLTAIGRRAREAARGAATIVIVAENEPQDTQAGAADRPTAATASTRCGTTTSTTARWSR